MKSAIGILWILGIALSGGPLTATPASGPGILLPVQDRIGDPQTRQLVETMLRFELSRILDFADNSQLRATLRRLRIRDLGTEIPERVEELARELNAEWFFSTTLHEASLEPVPRLIVSAQLLRADSPELHWAGFEAATGVDERSWLGLGGQEKMEDLVRVLVRRLVSRLEAPPQAEAAPKRLGRPRSIFVRGPISTENRELTAVITFDSVTDTAQLSSSEIATSALNAVLHDRGFRILSPGLLGAILQDVGEHQPGAVSASERIAISGRAGVSWIATGTTEIYEPGWGDPPRPWVAFSARMIDAQTGQIAWIGGRDLKGPETAATLDRHQIFSSGRLVLEMTRSLLDEVDAQTD